MSLVAGTRLRSYEISAPLGSGGMGDVYRARDRKLNRDVALKVLSGSLASDAAAGNDDRDVRRTREGTPRRDLAQYCRCAVVKYNDLVAHARRARRPQELAGSKRRSGFASHKPASVTAPICTSTNRLARSSC